MTTRQKSHLWTTGIAILVSILFLQSPQANLSVPILFFLYFWSGIGLGYIGRVSQEKQLSGLSNKKALLLLAKSTIYGPYIFETVEKMAQKRQTSL